MSAWRSVTSRGTRVTVPFKVTGGPIQFGDDPPIPLVHNGRAFQGTFIDADYVTVWNDDAALIMPGEDDVRETFLVLRGSREIISVASYRSRSTYGVRMNPTGYVLMPTSSTWIYTPFGSGMPTPPRPVPIPPGPSTSQGMSCLPPTNIPIFNTPGRETQVGGFGLKYWFLAGDWTVGINPPSDRTLAFHTPTQRMYVVTTTKAPVAPSGRMQPDGSLIVCLQLVGTTTSAFIPSSAFTPITASPTPDPPDDDEDEDDPMSTAQFNALRDAQKAMQASLASLHAKVEILDEKIDALSDGVPVPPDPGPDPEPPSGDAPEIDLASVTWLHTNVSGWAETSRIDHVGIEYPKNGDPDNGTVCFPHTKAGQWPTFDGGTGEGNVWVFGRINGQWYAATCEWLKPGQTCKRFSNRTAPDSWGIGPHTKKAPLESWGPKSGEWIGIMVSTRARDGQRSLDANGNPVLERSNVARVRWP